MTGSVWIARLSGDIWLCQRSARAVVDRQISEMISAARDYCRTSGNTTGVIWFGLRLDKCWKKICLLLINVCSTSKCVWAGYKVIEVSFCETFIVLPLWSDELQQVECYQDIKVCERNQTLHVPSSECNSDEFDIIVAVATMEPSVNAFWVKGYVHQIAVMIRGSIMEIV